MPGRAAGYPVTIKGKGNNAQRKAVSVAKDRLKAAKQFRNLTREQTWTESEEQYAGDHWGTDAPSGQDLIVVNYSFGNVNVIVPYMTGSHPNFLLQPYGNGATPFNAALQSAWLNRTWRSPTVAAQEELETAATDFVIYGDGYLKTGYAIEERRTDSELATYQDVAELWVSRLDPWDVWIDPASDGIHNARYVIQRFRMTPEELEASGFANTDEENVNFGTYHRVDQYEGSDRFGVRESMDTSEEYGILYEYFDLVRRTRIVFADGQAPLAYDEEVPVCPIAQMPNYRIPGSPYHMGDLEQIRGVQMELNKTRSQMITHRARGAQKFGAKKGVLGDDARTALQSSVVNELIELEVQEGVNINDVVVPFNVPGLSSDVYNVSELMIQDIYEISGITEFMRGAGSEVRKTATEVTVIEGASNAKVQHKLRQVEKVARKVGELLLGFAADVFPQTPFSEESMLLTGRDAEQVAQHANPEDLMDDAGPIAPSEAMVTVNPSQPDMWMGTYEVFVEQASTELRNPVMREQKYRQMILDLSPLQPMLQEQGKQLDMQRLISLWLESAGVEDVDSLFIPFQPPPMLEPGRVDVELGEQTPPEVLEELLVGAGLSDGLNMQMGVPELEMGEFGSDNTGMLPPVE